MAPAVRRSAKIRSWVLVTVWTAFIYSTLPAANSIWRWLLAVTGRRSEALGAVLMAALGVLVATFILRRVRRWPATTWLWLGGLVVVYALLLTSSWLLPAEKTHLFYYGVLAWAAWRAWAFDLRGRGLFATTVVFVGVLGGIDEGIQYLLPERVFEWKDVGLNLLAGFLATCVIALLDVRGRGNGIAG